MSRTTSPVRVPDAGDQLLYQQNVASVLPDAPAFSEAVRVLAPYKPFPGEDFAAFKARIEMSMAGAAAANDPAWPIWDPSKFESIAAADPASQGTMDTALARAFQEARAFAGAGDANPVAESVLVQLARLAPSMGLLPRTTDPATAEFAWSGVRMVFAAGGRPLHARLCRVLESAPAFPWTADEDQTTWNEAVAAAHTAMGWPSTLAVVRWSAFDALPDCADGPLPRWVYWRAWIHVLTTMRYDTATGMIRMVHKGLCSTVTPMTLTSTLGLQRQVLPALLHGLGCKSEMQKLAVAHALNRLSVANLLALKPVSSLPAAVIAGRWSQLVPDLSVEGWAEPNMRVANAWLAGEGRVSEGIADEEAVFDYAWTTDALDEDQQKDLRLFRSGVPTVYQPVWPGDLVQAVFPNLMDCGIANPIARRVMLDVVLVAELLRDECPALAGDYPLFAVLPEMPSLRESVNQGKTTLCSQYARACVPGLSQVTKFSESGSAPDQRAIAAELRDHGTVCLDEFAIPRSTTAILSRANLASLTTGGAAIVGKVLSNKNEQVSLKHALFASSKALDMTEDLLTRGVYIFMRGLSADERSAPGMQAITKGPRLGILLRLGTLAQIQKHGLADKLNAMQHSSDGWRWAAHRSLAMLLYQIHTGCSMPDAEVAIKAAILENRTRMVDHIRVADDEGVTMSQQQSRDVRITLEQMFAEVGPQEAGAMAQFLAGKPANGRPGAASHGCSIGNLVRARMSVDGRQDQPLSVGFNQWTNLGAAIGDRMVTTLLSNEIKNRISEHRGWRLPGMAGVDGWYLIRRKSRADGQVLVAIEKNPVVTP